MCKPWGWSVCYCVSQGSTSVPACCLFETLWKGNKRSASFNGTVGQTVSCIPRLWKIPSWQPAGECVWPSRGSPQGGEDLHTTTTTTTPPSGSRDFNITILNFLSRLEPLIRRRPKTGVFGSLYYTPNMTILRKGTVLKIKSLKSFQQNAGLCRPCDLKWRWLVALFSRRIDSWLLEHAWYGATALSLSALWLWPPSIKAV